MVNCVKMLPELVMSAATTIVEPSFVGKREHVVTTTAKNGTTLISCCGGGVFNA